MKGTDLSQRQLDAADRFLTRVDKGLVSKDAVGTIKRSDVVRLLAWYAAIRLNAVMPAADDVGDDGEPTGERE